jgi:alpha-glucosidase (family GH31 glycosyl hydrolase)
VAIATGRPLLRPLFFDDRDAAEAWAHPLQWRLGDDLLVSPVTDPGAHTWRIWLPPGEWVDVWTGESLAGDCVVERLVPLTEVPVYARAEAWAALAPLFADLPAAEAL